MLSLTAVILTYNEQNNIQRCIECAKLCTDNIVLIDSGSTDATVSIAEALGAKIYTRALAGDFAAQRNYALDKVDTEYVFYLDADEFVTDELAKDIKKAMDSKALEAYSILRKNIVFGERIEYGALAPDRVVRIFPVNSVTWEGKVHEKPIFDVPIQQLASYVWHETYRDWADYWRKFNNYTEIWANAAQAKGRTVTPMTCFIHAGIGFFKVFILKKGFLGGFISWIMCFNHCIYTLTKYARLYTLNNKKVTK